jgi:FtsZ-interacting cell division protein ZipA
VIVVTSVVVIVGIVGFGLWRWRARRRGKGSMVTSLMDEERRDEEKIER